jgi:predicted DNA binding CopG/RHH family protein
MAKRAPRKPVPAFANEREEREFWETHDASPFVDWDRARIAVFPNLKPSTETISLRLPTALLFELKALANKRDVPYQSLLKVFLVDRVASEMRRGNVLVDKAVQPSSRRRRKARPRRSRSTPRTVRPARASSTASARPT